MAGRVAYAVLIAAAVMVVGVVSSSSSSVSCSDAVNALVPCGSYLIGGGGDAAKPSRECCVSAQTLGKVAGESPESRKELCQCLKDSGPSFGVLPQRARQLPSLCKLHLDIPVSPTVDCNRLKTR